MTDKMIRAIASDGSIRVFVATTTALVDEARRRHETWPTATAALGRTLTAAGLFSATLKEEGESLTLRIAGDGPIGGIVCDADEQGKVRGYLRNPQVDLPLKDGKLDVGGAVGQGYVHVTRQLITEGTYTGTSEIRSGEIAEDLTYYMTTSEQTPSAVGLGVRVRPDGTVLASGGYMIQLLPSAPDAEREQLEINLAALGSISMAVEEGLSPEQVMGQLMAGIDYQIVEERELRFACRCARERALRAITLVEPEELEAMIEQDKGAELTCQFCNEIYRFTQAELREEVAHRTASEVPQRLH